MEEKEVVIIDAEEYEDGHFREGSTTEYSPEKAFFDWKLSEIVRCDCVVMVLAILTAAVALTLIGRFIFIKWIFDEPRMSVWSVLWRWVAIYLGYKSVKTWRTVLRPRYIMQRLRWRDRATIVFAAFATVAVVAWHIQLAVVTRQTQTMLSVLSLIQLLALATFIFVHIRKLYQIVSRSTDEDIAKMKDAAKHYK